MNTHHTAKQLPTSTLLYAGLLLAGAAFHALLSPKWVMPVFAWVAPALLLFYFRHATIKKKVLWFAIAISVAQIISAFDVFPFPLPVIVVLTLINTVKLLVVFFIDKWVAKRSSHFITTLVFPAAFATKDFLDISYSGGAWWSVANTQYGFHWLAQLSSVTGLIGISFIIYWFASVGVWCVEKYLARQKFSTGLGCYTAIFSLVMLFGAIRYNSGSTDAGPTVKIAGLTAPTFELMEGLYKDVYHKNITINPKISQTSKELQAVNSALIPFVENPDTAKFINGYQALYRLHDGLFALSKQAVDSGAKIISWSEANAIMPRNMQAAFIKRGELFAKANNVYLLMALGVFDSGKITPAKMFLENETILAGPNGSILNVFHKNHPVPYAEHSTPGDGNIPVIPTPYGRLAVSICYDADIPAGMRQLGSKKADILFLPSGDWYSIAPYHSYMAVMRGIENGCTIVRQASGGLSLVTDSRGKTLFSFDFYRPGQKLWVANIPIGGHVATAYASIGDAFAYGCIAITLAAMVFVLSFFLRGLFKGRRWHFGSTAAGVGG